MNLYIRYFDQEVLVKNADEAVAFLSEIEEVGMNPMLERDIREYVDSNVMYPKRYKVRPRVYFIIIKTEAETMEDFKEKKAVRPVAPAPKQELPALVRLNEERFGWYEGALDFKRVAVVPFDRLAAGPQDHPRADKPLFIGSGCGRGAKLKNRGGGPADLPLVMVPRQANRPAVVRRGVVLAERELAHSA